MPSDQNSGGTQFDEASFAHELAHGLSSLLVNSTDALEILSGKDTPLTVASQSHVMSHLRVIRAEAESQMFHALTVLSHLMPQYLTGLLTPRIESQSPYELLVSMIPTYAEKARARGIEIRAETAESSGGPKVDVEVNTLRRAFHNVLSNAIKYSYTGVTVAERHIAVWYERHDEGSNTWAVKVRNYGIGLKAHEHKLVFQPGYRGELARAGNTFGTGLGLADVQRCMRMHGGYARVVSKHLHDDAYVTVVSLVFPRVTEIGKAFGK